MSHLNQAQLMNQRMDGELSDSEINSMLKDQFIIFKEHDYDYELDTGLLWHKNDVCDGVVPELENVFDNIKFLTQLRDCM